MASAMRSNVCFAVTGRDFAIVSGPLSCRVVGRAAPSRRAYPGQAPDLVPLDARKM